MTKEFYKPQIAKAVSDEDPGELIRQVLEIAQEITVRLERLLQEVESYYVR